jgi:hypothetical protein
MENHEWTANMWTITTSKKRNETGDGDSESDQNNRKLMQNYHHTVDEICIVYAMVMV